MKHLDNLIGPVRRTMRQSFNALATADKRLLFTFYEGPYFKDWREKMDALQKGGGMKDYTRWLAATKQLDNWSNRFHFIIWLEAQGAMSAKKEKE